MRLHFTWLPGAVLLSTLSMHSYFSELTELIGDPCGGKMLVFTPKFQILAQYKRKIMIIGCTKAALLSFSY